MCTDRSNNYITGVLTLNNLVIYPLLNCDNKIELFFSFLESLRVCLYSSVSVQHVEDSILFISNRLRVKDCFMVLSFNTLHQVIKNYVICKHVSIIQSNHACIHPLGKQINFTVKHLIRGLLKIFQDQFIQLDPRVINNFLIY